MPLNMRWFPPCCSEFPGGRNDWNGQPVGWDWLTARATSNGSDSHCGFFSVSLQGSLLLPRPCFKRSHFQESNTTFHHFRRRKPANPEGGTGPTSAFGATRGPSVVKIRCLSSFPEGRDPKELGMLGSFGGDELTDYHAFGHMSGFKQSDKNTSHTREVRQYCIPKNCAVLWFVLVLWSLMEITSIFK